MLPRLLLLGQVVVRDVAYGLEAAREGHVLGLSWVCYLGEPVQLGLVVIVPIIEVDFSLTQLVLIKPIP